MSGHYIDIPPTGGSGLTSLNGLTGAVSLVAGSGISISVASPNITISATGGGAIVDTGSYGSPQTVAGSGAISVPTDQRGRIYVASTGGAVTGVTIGTGSGTHELYIVGASDTDTVQMASSANILLSGDIVLFAGTMLSLQWVAGLSKWLEVSRNDIF